MEELNFIESTEGTPQGGIMSPTLCNVALNGLEETIKLANPLIKGISQGVNLIRYADDMIITARTQDVAIKNKEILAEFLSERGLRLSPEKTKVFQIEQGVELDFLGYTFKYRTNWPKKYSFYKERIGMSGIALYPQKSKLRDIIDKIRLIFKNSQNLSAYHLIAKLNPIIRG